MRLVVALDLEGTLISNAVSAFPRLGLKQWQGPNPGRPG